MAGGVVAPTTRMRIDQEREAGAAGWEKEERREVTVERRKRRTRVPTRCPSHDESDARRIRGKPRTRTESLRALWALGALSALAASEPRARRTALPIHWQSTGRVFCGRRGREPADAPRRLFVVVIEEL